MNQDALVSFPPPKCDDSSMKLILKETKSVTLPITRWCSWAIKPFSDGQGHTGRVCAVGDHSTGSRMAERSAQSPALNLSASIVDFHLTITRLQHFRPALGTHSGVKLGKPKESRLVWLALFPSRENSHFSWKMTPKLWRCKSISSITNRPVY